MLEMLNEVTEDTPNIIKVNLEMDLQWVRYNIVLQYSWSGAKTNDI